jgi:hypothetical protein
MRRARLTPFFLFCLTISRPLGAQFQASGELGVSRVKQAAIPVSNAPTFAATIDGIFPRALIRTTGLISHADVDRWTAQGAASATLVGPIEHRVRWDLSGAVSGFAQTGAQTASSAEGLGRLLVGAGRHGAALGLGGGTRRADAGRQPFGTVSLSGWQGFWYEMFGVDVTLVQTATTLADNLPRVGLFYTDAAANWRHDQGRFSIGAVGGVRASNNVLAPSDGWGSVDASVWLASHVALVVAGGRSAQDVIRGIPRTLYGSVSFRVSSLARPSLARPRPGGMRLEATREYIEVRADSAAQVEVMGDFTDWTPVALERRGDVWRIERTMSPGLHRLLIRVDGGEWRPPVNLPRTKDELGGVVGLITVP